MSQILVGDDLHKSFGLTQALRGATSPSTRARSSP